MTPETFRDLVAELVLENPLAVRPLLRILEIRYTEEVPTLAVTCEERPALLVNLRFLEEHCRTGRHVQAVILHEFLHVLLRHTQKRGPATPAEHIAEDAVINAMIDRCAGPEFSSMMSRYYARAKGIERLLRPPTAKEKGDDEEWEGWEPWEAMGSVEEMLLGVWVNLYQGRIVVDDVRELAEDYLAKQQKSKDPAASPTGRLLGNHDDRDEATGPLREALETALQTMVGDGPFLQALGHGGGLDETTVAPVNVALDRWKRRTLEVLRRYVVPDPRSRATRPEESASFLPVLSPADRRAFLRATWSPFLPEASWSATAQRKRGTAQIYLDVSGSMSAEMPHLVALLNALRSWIRMPFWAFSTEVAPARIVEGVLRSRTTGGTSIECVLRHIAATRPESAVIVTDGYIEAVERAWLKDIARTRIYAVVSRNGSTAALDRGGIACTQLESLECRSLLPLFSRASKAAASCRTPKEGASHDPPE